MLAEFVWDDGGQSGMEYELLIALVALGVIAAAFGIGGDLASIAEQIRAMFAPQKGAYLCCYNPFWPPHP